MADIKKELNDIKNAVYGKEVRGSIHDGIKKINEEVEDSTETSKQAKHQVENIQEQVDNLVVSGDSSVEAAQARVDKDNHNYSTLKERLDTEQQQFETQLAETNTRISKESFYTKINGHGRTRPMIVFLDDDGRSQFYDKWKPIINQYNIPVTCALITGYIGEDDRFLNWSQVEELKEMGVEFVSHTHTHPRITELSDEELILEYKTSKNIMRERGLNDEVVVYPYGVSDDRTRMITRELFSAGVGTNEGINNTPINTYRLLRHGWFEQGRETVDDHKLLVDSTVATNGLLIFKTHSQYADFTGEQLDAIGEIIEYAQSLGVDIVSISEALKMFGNLIDVEGPYGNHVLGVDGTGNFPGFINSRAIAREGGVDKPVDYYPEGKSLTFFIYNDEQDLPFRKNGILETVNLGVSGEYSYQEYTPYRTNKIYRRYWDSTSKVWSKFEEVSNNANDWDLEVSPAESGWKGVLETRSNPMGLVTLKGVLTVGSSIYKNAVVCTIPQKHNYRGFEVVPALNLTKIEPVTFYLTNTSTNELRILDNTNLNVGDEIHFNHIINKNPMVD